MTTPADLDNLATLTQTAESVRTTLEANRALLERMAPVDDLVREWRRSAIRQGQPYGIESNPLLQQARSAQHQAREALEMGEQLLFVLQEKIAAATPQPAGLPC